MLELGRQDGLKIRWAVMLVWVQIPLVVLINLKIKIMKDLRVKKLKGGKFNKRICWKNKEDKDRRIDFEKMPFFYIIPKFGFRCENKKLQYIIFGWLFWEISFYRDGYTNQISTDDECKIYRNLN